MGLFLIKITNCQLLKYVFSTLSVCQFQLKEVCYLLFVVLWRYFPNIISVSQENAQPLSFQSLTKFLLIVLDYSRKQSFCCRGRGCVQRGYTFSFLLFLMSVSCHLLNGDRALHCKEYPWYIASRNIFYHFLS